MNFLQFFASKSIWTGVIMVGIGAAQLLAGIAIPGFTADPGLLIANGMGLIFLRQAVAKNGDGK